MQKLIKWLWYITPLHIFCLWFILCKPLFAEIQKFPIKKEVERRFTCWQDNSMLELRNKEVNNCCGNQYFFIAHLAKWADCWNCQPTPEQRYCPNFDDDVYQFFYVFVFLILFLFFVCLPYINKIIIDIYQGWVNWKWNGNLV